jgi:hypothetical protein
VEVPGGENYKVVFCNFPDGQFQVNTEVTFAEFPVAFDFSREYGYDTASSVIPYETANVNVGGGMTLAGTFTAPLDGVYAFSFFFQEGGFDGSPTYVEIRVDGDTVADSVKAYRGSGATYGDTVTVLLTKGQQVDAFLKRGGIGVGADTHFAGHLLFPL